MPPCVSTCQHVNIACCVWDTTTLASQFHVGSSLCTELLHLYDMLANCNKIAKESTHFMACLPQICLTYKLLLSSKSQIPTAPPLGGSEPNRRPTVCIATEPKILLIVVAKLEHTPIPSVWVKTSWNSIKMTRIPFIPPRRSMIIREVDTVCHWNTKFTRRNRSRTTFS